MEQREWDVPIDSRLLFKLLQTITKQQNKNKLYKLLLLDSNEGQCFAGTNGRVKYCWWPDHVNWFFIAASAFDMAESALYDVKQKFPLPKNPRLWSEIATRLNEKEWKKDGSFTGTVYYTQEDTEHQLTFESHVYAVLSEQLTCCLSDDEAKKRDLILKVCKDEGIPKYEQNRISEMEKVEDILVYLITRAKAASGSSLTLPHAPDPVDTSCAAEDWQILSFDALNADPMAISARILENDKALYEKLPPSCAGSQKQWASMFTAFADYCRFLVDGQGTIQGNYSIVGLSPDQERAMLQGQLVDSELDVFACDHLHSAGEHAIYLLNLSVNPGVEIDKYYQLWDDLISLIKDCAKSGIFFSRIYYKAFLPEHAAMVLGRGFDFHCYDAAYGRIYLHNMDSDTTLRILDEELAFLYHNRKTSLRKNAVSSVSQDQLEAETAFLSLFREIDELFLNPRFCELKPYFFNGLGTPEDPALRKLGVAAAELLRDILQYSASFLSYLPDHRKRSYDEYAKILLSSQLVRESMGEYQFTTEKNGNQIAHVGYSSISIKDIATYARIWIGIDRLFLREDLLALRPYFYEYKHCLPDEQEMDDAAALAVRILSGMKISEYLVNRIPHPFVISYFDYKEMMKNVCIIQHVVANNPFLKEELGW